jgi:hypothetical protein
MKLSAKFALPRRMPEWILHDLRRTASTVMADGEWLSIAPRVVGDFESCGRRHLWRSRHLQQKRIPQGARHRAGGLGRYVLALLQRPAAITSHACCCVSRAMPAPLPRVARLRACMLLRGASTGKVPASMAARTQARAAAWNSLRHNGEQNRCGLPPVVRGKNCRRTKGSRQDQSSSTSRLALSRLAMKLRTAPSRQSYAWRSWRVWGIQVRHHGSSARSTSC